MSFALPLRVRSESGSTSDARLSGLALALVAIGYRALSLAPSAVGPVKAMLLALDAGKAAAFIAPLIDSPVGSVQIRERLKKFAAEQELPI